jgi:hypothetical protein
MIAGVTNLHTPNQISMKLWGHAASLDKVLSEGRVYATMP